MSITKRQTKGAGPSEADLDRRGVRPGEAMLSEADLDRRWGRKHGFARSLRLRGEGPPFHRLAPRVYAYRAADVEEFERARRFKSQAEAL